MKLSDRFYCNFRSPYLKNITQKIKFQFLVSFFIIIVNACGPTPLPKQISGNKYLIINGDDLCLDLKTDQAIISAYQRGILTSTTAFINLEGAVENIKRIHHEHPELPIGLHLNITLGSPVSKAAEVKQIIGKNNQFYDVGKILKHLPDMPVEEVRKELFAQVELFLSTGVPLNHIDYHHHLTALYTPFFELVREIALKYNVPVRNPVPASIYNLISVTETGGGGSESMRRLIFFGIIHPFKSIPMMSKVGPDAFIDQERQMLTEGIKSPDWFIDSFYENASVENLISILQQLPAGVSEIMCHPGMEGELEVLTDESVKKIVDSLNIQLVSWDHFKLKN